MRSSPQTSTILGRWARITVDHRWAVLAVSFLLFVSLGLLYRTQHGEFVNSINVPGAESQQAIDLLRERMPERAGDSATVVIQSDAGFETPDIQAEVESMADDALEIPGVVGVVTPYTPGTVALSDDGTIGFLLVQFAEQADSVPSASIDALYDLQTAYSADGFQVELGGQVITASEKSPPSSSEALGVVAAVIILLIAFGSVVAMGLPLITAFAGLATSFFLVGLLSREINFITETQALAAMLGIGVGIDYALFIVTRYREGLHNGLSVEDAVVEAINTAGRSILFAGAIVITALLGLYAIGIPFVGALGLASAIVVTLAVLVALTVLPALLAVIGRRIDRWSISRFSHRSTEMEQTVWYRLTDWIQHHPWPVAIAAVLLLLVLALPAIDMRIGSSDAGNGPTSLTSRRAYDLLTDGFGAGFNGPLTVVLDVSDGADSLVIDRLAREIQADPTVAFVSPPVFNPAARDTAILTVVPTTAPQSEETEELVHRLRNDVIEPRLEDTNVTAYVGGPTAAFIDIADQINARLPYFFLVVVGASMILLLFVFRSLLIPVQAAIMNLLSIGAAYGVLVAVFQWGWLSGLVGIDRTGPIESFLPMMLFAVLFGLSTDYEVFLMSRIHEAWLKSGDNRAAVNFGSATTTRVITAAAAIMVVVFLSFTLSDTRIVKEFGLGLATAVFIDATVIRMFLVPAVTGLLGSSNWYLPAWLDRWLPQVSLEIPEPAPERVVNTIGAIPSEMSGSGVKEL